MSISPEHLGNLAESFQTYQRIADAIPEASTIPIPVVAGIAADNFAKSIKELRLHSQVDLEEIKANARVTDVSARDFVLRRSGFVGSLVGLFDDVAAFGETIDMSVLPSLYDEPDAIAEELTRRHDYVLLDLPNRIKAHQRLPEHLRTRAKVTSDNKGFYFGGRFTPFVPYSY